MLKLNNRSNAPATASTESVKEKPVKGYVLDVVVAESLLAVEREYAAVESLVADAAALEAVYAATEAHGVSPAILAYMTNANLLSSTAMTTPSLESFLDADADREVLSTAAMEGIIDSIKEKVAAWSAKAWDFLKSLGSRVTAAAGKAVSWLGDMANKVKDATFDAARAAKEAVTAHPYATVAGAIAGIAAIGGIGAMVFGGGFPQTREAAKGISEKIAATVRNIKFPGVKAEVGKNGLTKFQRMKIIAQKRPMTALGWSKKSIVELITKAIQALKDLPGKVSASFSSAVKMIKDAGSKVDAKVMMKGVASRAPGEGSSTMAGITMHAPLSKWEWIRSAVTLMKDAVVGYFFQGLEVIRSAFRVVLKFFKNGKDAAAAAGGVAQLTAP